MPAICFRSPKGGVGKTTLSVNVAGALARSGVRVLIVDLDVQNSLRLHAGIHLRDGRGWASCLLNQRPVREGVHPGGGNLFVLPFGQVTPEGLGSVSLYLSQNGHWLQEALAPFVESGFVIVFDTAPGPLLLVDLALAQSALEIVVLQADATSLSLLPGIEEQHAAEQARGVTRDLRYVFNMIDLRRRMTRDLVRLTHQKLGDAVLGLVHYDDSFGDAVAHQQLVFERAPASKAARDVLHLAARVEGLLSGHREPGRKTG